MPRILRIINRFNLGGPTYNVAYLTKFLPPEYETLLVGGMPDESEGKSAHILQNLGIEPLIINEMKRSISPEMDYVAYRKIRKLIREFKPDIVHTHASKAGALGRLAASKERVPVLVHTFHGHVFHSYFGKAQTYFYKSIERRMAKMTDCIIAISEGQKEELSGEHRICPAEKISIIPLGFDLERFWTDSEIKRRRFRDTYKLAEGQVAVGIIGRLVPVKNHLLFLDSAKNVWEKFPEKVRFFVIGDGELRSQLLDYCQLIGLPAAYMPDDSSRFAVTLTSWINEADRAMAGLDIIALTSFNEGTPVSLIEAQAASKPVVSTRVGGIANIVRENETALLSEVDNPREFTEHLERLVLDNSLRMSMSLNGRIFVESRFHYNRLVKDTDLLYKRLMEYKESKK
jgi:glycosyltransferase involved in cell wall biosynthesis